MNTNEYMAVYMLQRYHDRRNTAIKKLGGKCVKCGSIEQLEIDHIDKSKKTMNISKMWSCSQAKYDKEIELCQLLCHDCHKEKSRQESSVGHGQGLTGKRNCRCALCAPLKNAYNLRYK